MGCITVKCRYLIASKKANFFFFGFLSVFSFLMSLHCLYDASADGY